MEFDEAMLDVFDGFAPTICQFKLDIDETYGCKEPIFVGSLCLFHAPKLTESERRALSRSEQREAREVEFEFRRKLGELIQLSESAPDIERVDLRGFRFPKTEFPKAFSKPLDLSKAVFIGEANFEGTVFREDVHFDVAKILAYATFQGATFSKEASFQNVDFGENGRLLFKNVDLGRARFMNTNLEYALFSNVQWHRHHVSFASLLLRSQSLWDEFRPTAKDERVPAFYEAVAENYRQLVLNYEQKRDYDSAENFHIGELEMRRRMRGAEIKPQWAGKFRSWFNEYGAYRILSNYGTSYVQGLLVLLVLIMTLSAVFLYAGFKKTEKDNQDQSVIEYDVWSDSTHKRATGAQWLSDYVSAVSLSLSIVTLQKDRYYEPLPGIARLWVYVAVVALAGQSALVLLAVRRRFRR